MRIKVTTAVTGSRSPANHPNEVVVLINTREGQEQLVVHQRSISDGSIEIGYPISEEGHFYLIELPRETAGGLWRVWVDQNELISTPKVKRRA